MVLYLQSARFTCFAICNICHDMDFFFCLCRKPTVVTKYVGSDDEQVLDETVNEDISNENSENDVDMKSLPKGSLFFFVSEFSKLVKIMMQHK